MSEVSPLPRGRPVSRLPHVDASDRPVAERLQQPTSSPAGRAGQAQDPVDYSGLGDPQPNDDPAFATDPADGCERGGYGGLAPTVAAKRDGADLADLSHSLGDGARYAVEIGRARADAETPKARAARLRLRWALEGVRRVCARAMRQRMHTEMLDLASQIRKMHDRDDSPR